MVNGLVNLWQLFKTTLRGFDSSRQLALGVTLGMLVGMVPNDSLFTYLFGCVLLLSTANLITGALSAFSFSWISLSLDPISNQLGTFLLTFDLFEPTWCWLAELPVVPWTRFENTIVTGSIVLSLIVAMPVYFTSRFVFDKYRERAISYLSNSYLGKWLMGSPAQPEGAE